VAQAEASFSISRKIGINNDLVTVRGDSGEELLDNFIWMFGLDAANVYFTTLRGLQATADTLGSDANREAVADFLKKPAQGSGVGLDPQAAASDVASPAASPGAATASGGSGLSEAQLAALEKLKNK
jgi:hypothetical protein